MARAKNDNLVNEFDRVCHCCQRHIHFERNKSVENVLYLKISIGMKTVLKRNIQTNQYLWKIFQSTKKMHM